MKNHHPHIKIYHSKRHLAATFAFLLLPFLVLLTFSEFTRIPINRLVFDTGISIFRLFAAYIIATALGWLFATSFYSGRRAAIMLPIFDVLQSFPTFAALPLAVLAWGSNGFIVIFFLALAIIWPVFFSVVSSLKLIRKDWQEVLAIYKPSRIRYITKFVLPVSWPGLITGSIVGLGDGWEALVATEIIIKTKTGLGSFFSSVADNPYSTTLAILALLTLVFSINKLIWLPLLERSHRLLEE